MLIPSTRRPNIRCKSSESWLPIDPWSTQHFSNLVMADDLDRLGELPLVGHVGQLLDRQQARCPGIHAAVQPHGIFIDDELVGPDH